MQKPAKMGRPTIPEKQKLSKIYAARFRAEDERVILCAIESSGKPQAEWIREALLKVARTKTG